MIIGVIDSANDCHFALRVDDNVDVELVKTLAMCGLTAWYKAAWLDDEIDDDEYFTKEEIIGFYDFGYAEPASILLERYNIHHEVEELRFDDDDNAVCDDSVWY